MKQIKTIAPIQKEPRKDGNNYAGIAGSRDDQAGH